MKDMRVLHGELLNSRAKPSRTQPAIPAQPTQLAKPNPTQSAPAQPTELAEPKYNNEMANHRSFNSVSLLS